MKKHCRILFATALFLIALVSCKEEALNLTSETPAWQAQTRAAIEGLNANSMKVLSSTESSLVLELDVNNYAKNVVSIDGKEYFAISASEAHSMLKEGNPDLPEYAYSVVIPPTSACNVRVVDAEYEDISLPVAPSKGGLISSTESNPYTFSEAYEKDAFYPAKLASADAPFLMRDVRGSVVRLHPFQYNPVTGTLRVYKKMKVEVSFSGTDDRNVRTSGVRHTIDKSMEELFRKQFINYDVMMGSSTSFSTIKEKGKGIKKPLPTEKMLIICCDSFATYMSNFVSYKKSIWGIPSTKLVTMSQVGTSAEDVIDYIQDEYNLNANLLYVLLVGDAERVPTISCGDGANTSGDNGAADPFYALVSGGDSIPDIFVGRFSARNHSEVQTMVDRTIDYEIMSIQTWQHKSIGICDGWTNNAPYYNYEYMNSILEMLDYSDYGTGGLTGLYDIYPYNYITGYVNATTIYLPTINDTSNAINDGAFIINYIGDGFWNTWNVNGYYDIPGYLQNYNKLPFVFSASPGVGDLTGCNYFSTDPCFAERWLTARTNVNNTTVARGAVGFYGSSISSLNIELISAALNFNSVLTTYSSATRNFGVLCYNSAITMRNQYGSAANYVLLKWNYFGDPSLKVIPNLYVTPPAK